MLGSLRPAVVALFASSGLSILIMACAFAATCIWGVNVAYIILACALLGAARPLLRRIREGGGGK